MSDYPKKDHEIILLTADNSRITGCINVLGRSISAYLQGPEPDIVMYNCLVDGIKGSDTLMISKKQILWVNSREKTDEEKLGSWKTLMFRLVNGTMIKGCVNTTGYDRVSDFIQNELGRFYEVHDVDAGGYLCDMFYVSREHTVWKKPVND
jgi:hypothetical protein